MPTRVLERTVPTTQEVRQAGEDVAKNKAADVMEGNLQRGEKGQLPEGPLGRKDIEKIERWSSKLEEGDHEILHEIKKLVDIKVGRGKGKSDTARKRRAEINALSQEFADLYNAGKAEVPKQHGGGRTYAEDLPPEVVAAREAKKVESAERAAVVKEAQDKGVTPPPTAKETEAARTPLPASKAPVLHSVQEAKNAADRLAARKRATKADEAAWNEYIARELDPETEKIKGTSWAVETDRIADRATDEHGETRQENRQQDEESAAAEQMSKRRDELAAEKQKFVGQKKKTAAQIDKQALEEARARLAEHIRRLTEVVGLKPETIAKLRTMAEHGLTPVERANAKAKLAADRKLKAEAEAKMVAERNKPEPEGPTHDATGRKVGIKSGVGAHLEEALATKREARAKAEEAATAAEAAKRTSGKAIELPETGGTVVGAVKHEFVTETKGRKIVRTAKEKAAQRKTEGEARTTLTLKPKVTPEETATPARTSAPVEEKTVAKEAEYKPEPNKTGKKYEEGEHPEITVVDTDVNTAGALKRDIHETIADSGHADIFEPGADAVVSPANSVGHMNGGIDLRYMNHFGPQLERRVRQKIVDDYGGELPIGEAFVVRTREPGVPIKKGEPEWLIVSPTMTQPGVGRSSPDIVTKATLAALRAGREAGVKHIAMPAMGTGVGKMDPRLSSAAIKKALLQFEAEVYGDVPGPGDRQFSKFDESTLRERADDLRREMELETGERMTPVYHGTRDNVAQRVADTNDIVLARSDLHGGEAHYSWFSPEQALDWAKHKFGERGGVFASVIPEKIFQQLTRSKDIVVRPMHWHKEGAAGAEYPHEVVLSQKAIDEIYMNERLLSKHEGAAKMTDAERLDLIQQALGPDAKVSLDARENSYERRKDLIRLSKDADRTAVLHEIFHAVETTLKPHEQALIQNHPKFREVQAEVQRLYPELNPHGQMLEALAETSARLRNQHLTDSLLWRTIEKVRAQISAWTRSFTGSDIRDVRDLMHDIYSGGRKEGRTAKPYDVNKGIAEVAYSKFLDDAKDRMTKAIGNIDTPGHAARLDRVANKFHTVMGLGQKAEQLGFGDRGRKVYDDVEGMRVYRDGLLEAKGGTHEIVREGAALQRKYQGEHWERFLDTGENASRLAIRPDVPLDHADNLHISKGDKTEQYQAKAAYAEIAREYQRLPQELKDHWHKASDFFRNQQNAVHEAIVNEYVEMVLGKVDKDLARRIHQNRLTPEEAADARIGAAMKALHDVPELGVIKGTYLPFMRRGDFVVAGEHKLDAPPEKIIAKPLRGKGSFEVTTKTEGDTITFTVDAGTRGAASALRRTVQEHVGKQGPTQRSVVKYSSDATGKRDEHGTHLTYEAKFHTRHMEQHDRLIDAEKRRDELRKGGMDVREVDAKREGQFQNNDLMGTGLRTMLKTMEQTSAWKEKSERQKATIRQTFIEQSLRMASANRASHRFMQRKGISGMSRDYVRNVLDYGSANASMLAGYKYRPQIEGNLLAMNQQISDDPYNKDTIKRRQLLNEMSNRVHQNSSADGPSGRLDSLINRALQLSFLDKLASPAFHAINSLQPTMVALPVLAGRHGLRAVGALSGAYKEIGGLRTIKQGFKETANAVREADSTGFDYLRSFQDRVPDAGAKRMFQALHDAGLMDKHSGMEIALLADPASNMLGRGLDRADHIARQMGQAIESMNRAAPALAAYRLEMAKHGNEAKAIQYAKDVVHDTQGNYSRSNSPAMFNTRLGRATLQFKKYPLMMYSLMGKQLKQALGGDKDAMRTLAGLAATHMAMAGALGLPTEPFKILLMAANVFGITGTTWEDVEDQARTQAAQFMGPVGGEAFMRGLPRLLGFDLSGRVGTDNLALQGSPRKMDENGVKSWAFDNLKGAPLAYGIDVGKGVNALASGDFGKAFELMFPLKTLTDTAKAVRGGMEGKKTAGGREIMSPYTPLEMAYQAFGLTPARVAEANAATGSAYRRTGEIKQDRQALINGYSEGTTTMADVLKFNKGKPLAEQIKIRTLLRAKKDDNRDEKFGQTVQPWNKRTLEEVGGTYNVRQ